MLKKDIHPQHRFRYYYGVLSLKTKFRLDATYLVGLVGIAFFLIISAVRLFFPWQIDYVEGLSLYVSSLIAKGANVYSYEPSVSGFTSASYPFLAYVPSLLAHLISGRNVFSLLLARVFYFAFSIASLVLVYRISSNIFESRFLGVISVLTLISLRPFNYWSVTIRPDVLALPLILLAIHVVFKRKYRFLILLIPLILCVKQQYVDLVLALIIYSLISKDMELMKNTILGLAFSAIVFLAHEIIYPGFIVSTIIYNMLHTKSLIHAFNITNYSFTYSLVSVTIILLAIFSSLRSISERGVLAFISTYFLLNLSLSFILSSKLGSNTNYFIVSSALVSLTIPYVLRVLKSRNVRLVFLIVLVLAGIWCTLDSFGFNVESYVEGMALHDSLLSFKGYVTAWCTDYFLAYISGLNVPVDVFYYSRLVENNVLPDINALGISVDLVIWDYNVWRVTDYISFLIEHSKPLVLGDYLGVYLVNGRVAEPMDFIVSYSRSYAKYYVIAQQTVYSCFGAFRKVNVPLLYLSSLLTLLWFAMLFREVFRKKPLTP